MIKRIAFTMYPVKDIVRARDFYENKVGLTMSANFRDEWIEYDPGGCFAITTMTAVEPAANAGGSIAFEVDDVDLLTERLQKGGATVKVPPFSTPVCRMAVLIDTEGNAFTLHKLARAT